MSSIRIVISFLTLIWLCGELVRAQSACAPAGPGNIVVDINGHGQLKSLGAAIESIPARNNQWRMILVKPGVYWEKVHIPRDKPCISIQGSGIVTTKIVFNESFTTVASPTFIVDAEYVVAKYITFENSYSLDGINVKQAIAVLANSDKIAFYGCAFSSWQDTLWDHSGRHYYKLCHIYGAVDFIWGGGQSIFEKCILHLRNAPPSRSIGWLTAQGRNSAQDTSGFVFKYGSVYGANYSYYLGRAYGSYARVLFYKFQFDGHVAPLGWDAWSHVHHEDQLIYSEKNCTGQGSDLSKRVKWEKTLTSEEWAQFLGLDYINGDKWIQELPDWQQLVS